MTAVEFIFEELENRENGFPHFTTQQIYEKAKEMEKQQIIDSHLNGQSEFDKGKFRTEVIKNAEQYYNETFKNK